MSTHRWTDVKAAQDKKRKRSHKNTRRLTAKERAVATARAAWNDEASLSGVIQAALQAHAREAVARHKRKHAVAWDRILAKGAGK